MTHTMPSRPPAADAPEPNRADPTAPESRERPPEEKKSGLGLSTPQVAGSALASVSAAIAASWLGVAGTIIGAALGSLFGTVGSALYAQTLRNSRVAVQKIVPTRPGPANRANRTGQANQPGRAGQDDAAGSVDNTEESTEESTETQEVMVRADQAGLRDRLRALKWKRILVGSAVVLVIALGAITALEQLTGSPVSRYTGGNDNQGTTIGRVFGGSSSTSDDTGQDPSGEQNESNQPDHLEPTTTPDPTGDATTDSGGDDSEPTEPEPDSEPTPPAEPTAPAEPDPDAQGPLSPTTPTAPASPDTDNDTEPRQSTKTTPVL